MACDCIVYYMAFCASYWNLREVRSMSKKYLIEQEVKIGDEAIFSDGKRGYIVEIDGYIYKAINEDFEIGTWCKLGFTLTGKNIPEIAIAYKKIKGE